jgi:tetratricopeptide (TPR) repeat protein
MEAPTGPFDAGSWLMRSLAAALTLSAMAACAPSGEQALVQAEAVCQGLVFGDPVAACSAVIADPNADARQRATALVARGQSRAVNGQDGRAIADFGRALRADPTHVDALVHRGVVHSDRGAYEPALRDFDAVLALFPGHELASAERQTVLQRRGDAFSAQIAQVTEMLTRAPFDPSLLNTRCWMRATAGRELELALADCNLALIQNPQFAAALDSRGLVQLKRQAYAEALTDYEAALVIEPGRGHYLYGRGLARRALSIEGAEADLAAGEAAEPGVTELYRGYGL